MKDLDQALFQKQTHQHQKVTGTAGEYKRAVEASCKPVGYSALNAKQNRRKHFAMDNFFGGHSIFLTTTPCDERTIRVQVFANAGKEVSLPNLRDWDDKAHSVAIYVKSPSVSVSRLHDGSYMPQLTSQACSCGFVLYCSSTDKRAIGSFAEESDNADNYRGEWLGSIGALQVLLAVISTTSVSLDAIPPVQAHCDNMGVINHNQNLTRSLPEKQAQADLIRLCWEYRRRLGFSIEYHH
eukprot:scaffold17614_cov185-Skeletonema_dohrnii-CCMP3373.AAC.1